MALELGRLARLLSGLRVEDAAACARALTALVGRGAPAELVPGGAAMATRAVLTGRVMAEAGPVPWPNAVTRQLDPDDPAFLPALGMHPVLAARDATALGLPGREATAWLDPTGWCGLGAGPAVTVWFGDTRRAWTVGPRPLERGAGGVVVQERSDEGVGVRTVCTRGELELTLVHWSVVIGGEVAWALHARLQQHGPASRPVRLAFAVRPAGPEGVSPVFHLARDTEGLWTADGRPLLALARTGDELFTGRHDTTDPWQRFSGEVFEGPALRPGPIDLRCPVGLASAAEVTRATLSPGEPLVRLAIIAPPKGTPAALVRTSGPSLWSNAHADRRGQLAAGCEIRLVEHQRLFEAVRQRLLIEPPGPGLAACLGTVALARMGFSRRAADRVGAWLGRVRRDGSLPGAEAEHAAVLAWAAAEVVRWVGDTAWVHEQLTPWTRLLDRLVEATPEPGGHALIGPEGSARWTATWLTAALLQGSVALRGHAERHRAWAIAGGRHRESLPQVLGPAPWSIAPGRASDGAAAGLLAACWLGLVPAEHPHAARTIAHLRAHYWHGGGVLLHGGAHLAATALLVAVQARQEPDLDPLGVVARLASPTGALPTARHPSRGALGEGDDPLSAALFALLALDRVQVGRGHLSVLPGLAAASDLPTPFGRIDVQALPEGGRRVIGRWRGTPPTVTVVGERPEQG